MDILLGENYMSWYKVLCIGNEPSQVVYIEASCPEDACQKVFNMYFGRSGYNEFRWIK